MEIFLLLVVILLLVIFNSSKKSRIKLLEQKLSNIENYLKNIQFTQQKVPAQKPETTGQTNISPSISLVPPRTEEKPVTRHEELVPPVREVRVESVPQIPVNTPSPVKTPVVTAQKPIQSISARESSYERFRKNNPDLEKFISENILSKIAIVVLVIGIAFFLKYAIDEAWINELARVGIGILCGVIVLGFAHRLHKKFKAFSSVLVAGGISIFYFTVGIGFHQYHIFNQTTAFFIMLLITTFSVFISILYDRIELAALSIIGGFATPFMASSGQGHYQVLFCYVLILDIGMLVLAYLRKWNLVNILTYAFTLLLYFSWLQTKVIGQPAAPYSGAFLFGAIFYVVFVLMNIINNVKEKRNFGSLELSILISNTFLFYGAGMQILAHYHPEHRGAFSICLAVFNLICAWLLFKKFKADVKLVYLMIGLTLTFTTLVAPVQLHGNYITLFWALEAVLLMWLAQKSQIVLYRFVSVIITFLMFLSLITDWTSVYTNSSLVPVIFNKAFITGFTASLCLMGLVLLLRKEQETVSYLGISFHPRNYSVVLKIGGISLLYLSGFLELIHQLNAHLTQMAAICIITYSYHLLFVSALNGFTWGLNNKAAQKGMYILNFVSVLLFLIGFALLPVFDLKENCIAVQASHVGFAFHYVSVGCFLFIVYTTYKIIKRSDSAIKNYLTLHTVLLSVGLTYLCSVELVLSILKTKMTPVDGTTTAEIIAKLSEFGVNCTSVVKIGFPILWGLLALAFLFLGMKKQNKPLRIVALALIALTLLKLFTFDIRHASEAGKIVAFIILGIVLLITSFMYQKIKALLLDNEKKAVDNKDKI